MCVCIAYAVTSPTRKNDYSWLCGVLKHLSLCWHVAQILKTTWTKYSPWCNYNMCWVVHVSWQRQRKIAAREKQSQLVLCNFQWKFELNIMFYSEVTVKNVASKIRQLLHRKNGTERCIMMCFLKLIKRCFQWTIRHKLMEAISKSPKSMSWMSRHNLDLHTAFGLCDLASPKYIRSIWLSWTGFSKHSTIQSCILLRNICRSWLCHRLCPCHETKNSYAG